MIADVAQKRRTTQPAHASVNAMRGFKMWMIVTRGRVRLWVWFRPLGGVATVGGMGALRRWKCSRRGCRRVRVSRMEKVGAGCLRRRSRG